MIIWRGAIPRSGGTVSEKVARFLLDRNGIAYQEIDYRQIQKLQRLSEAGSLSDAAAESFRKQTYCGAHDIFFSSVMRRNFFRVLFVRRNFLDCLASYQRLGKTTFETLPPRVKTWAQVVVNMEQLPDETCLKLSYENDVLNIPRLTRRIADFLDLPCDDETIELADQKFNRASLRKATHIGAESVREELRSMHVAEDQPKMRICIADKSGESECYTLPMSILTDKSMLVARQAKPGQAIGVLEVNLPNSGLVRLARNQAPEYRIVLNNFGEEHISSLDAHRSPAEAYLTEEQRTLLREIYEPILAGVPEMVA
jgi:hypothetical protein